MGKRGGKAMIRIENKETGQIIETTLSNWRNALNSIKFSAKYWNDTPVTTKASYMINHIKNGYEDQFIKAYVV